MTPPPHPRGRDGSAAVTYAELREAVTSEVRQQMTAPVLQIDGMLRDLVQIKWTLYGNEQAGELGLVKSVKSISTKLDTIIENQEARNNQWRGIKIAITVLAAMSSIPALQIVLPAIGKVITALSGTP